ncbi:hypothetical protein [Methylorubrum suomiense]|uniref:Uncharacterized protein n=1 Tax=Methylorubrum suomiense TaxID=144191 RepID=A0ABQ4V0K7_9HYPH|nr:hypothetical protein [Methylorubrum suomiense]GJE78131.1 hypothetical protein BGCPKDLD_4742 [Methylorubrum suomiense]
MRRNIKQELIFPVRSVEDESRKRRNHNFIECSHCPETASMPISVSAGAMGEEVLTKRFTRLGWYVSRVPGGHLCPTCNPTKQRAILTLVTPKPDNAEEPTVARELTFADRRIINAKLEETYENDLVGYREGWDDSLVAADLGTSVLWVEQLRSQNFGPAEGNRVIVELRAEQEQLAKRMEAFRTEGQALAAAFAELSAKLDAAGLKAA